MYGKRSVKITVNDISHMARSSTEAVYVYIVSEELEINLNSDFLQLKWLTNQSRMVKEPVIFYPLRLW